MKKLVTILLVLCLIVPCMTAFAEDQRVIKVLTYNVSYDIREAALQLYFLILGSFTIDDSQLIRLGVIN